MLPPARLLVGTGCLVVAIVANKLRQRNESIQRSKKQQNQTVVRDVKEVVHAYASMSPAVPVSQQVVSPAGLRGSRGLLAICTLLICSALVTAALREQWDVVASVGMAWTLLLLNQVGCRCGCTLSDSSGAVFLFIKAVTLLCSWSERFSAVYLSSTCILW